MIMKKYDWFILMFFLDRDEMCMGNCIAGQVREWEVLF